MKTRLSISQIRGVAHLRPEGYVEDVLSKGEVVVLPEGEYLDIEMGELMALIDKYKDHVRPHNDAEFLRRFHAGPGTELKVLLAGWPFRIQTTANCKCNRRANYMNEKGCDWCEANVDEIVGWLREEAQERGLPFVDVVGRLLVRRAIANARRKEAADAGRSQRQD